MTLILLHAIGLDAGSWRFAAIPNATALDLPGYGDEPLPASGLKLAAMADDIVKRAPRGPLDVVGVSMGSQVAMQMGLRHPARVASLLLANSGPAADPAMMRSRAESVASGGKDAHVQANIDRWFSERARAAGHPAIDYVRKCLMRDSVEALQAGWLAIAEHNVSDRLGEFQMPVTVLAASEDKAAPVSALEVMARGIRRGRLELIEGPHLVYMEAPERIRSAVLAHLEWAAA